MPDETKEKRAHLHELLPLAHIARARVEPFGMHLRVDKGLDARLALQGDAGLAPAMVQVILNGLHQKLAGAAAAEFWQDCTRAR